jgi:hypothetical protein
MESDQLICGSELSEEEILFGCESGLLEFVGVEAGVEIYRRRLIRAVPPDEDRDDD